MTRSRKMLVFVLAGLWMLRGPQVSGYTGGDASFFALRSCHQQLGADSGEFFSPDYLCSNPPLWCNWTIRVDPRKRVHLDLEDLTPEDVCHLKQDQLHVEDPSGGHKLLLKCWREARFTSSTNTLEVVLLIGGWPGAPYRGFYGRYQAFGPPEVYNPEEVLLGQTPLPAEPGHLSDLMAEELDDEDQIDQIHHPAHTPPTSLAVLGTARSGRGATQSSPDQDQELGPPSYTSTGTPWEEEQEGEEEEREGNDEEQEEDQGQEEEDQGQEGDQGQEEDQGEEEEQDEEIQGEMEEEESEYGHRPTTTLLPGPEPEQRDSGTNVMEPLSDHRGTFVTRNLSESPHLPGDHLFEVAVEVNFSQDQDESWDHVARALLLSIKALIRDQLKVLPAPLSMSSKRIKRLNAGALFILWVQMGQVPGGGQIHGVVHAGLQGLISADVGGNRSGATVVSVSTADVNECGTQLVLCDVNADCFNRFGSYSCHCRPGFRDVSRLGSGGTACIDMTPTGLGPGLAAEAKGVYVLFFLLSSLVLMLLAAAGLLYHRHRRGAFRPRCRHVLDRNTSRRHDDRGPAEHQLPPLPPPPPPPPARGLQEGWGKERRPAVELPLLRFSPLVMDGYKEPLERGKI